ncbi:MAG: NADPH-dependent FMN reductase [Balneolaceae bacterium]
MKIIGISGSLSKHSKTELTVQKSLDLISEQDPTIQTELIALSAYDLVFCDGRNPDSYEADTRTVIDKIIAADALIIGSPIYRGTFSGAFKNLFDLIPNDSIRGKAVGIIATGGSDHHFLAIEHQFKPLIGYFNAYSIPGGVYAKNGHFTNGELTDSNVLQRLEDLAKETVRLSTLLNNTYKGPAEPDIKRESLQES